MTRYRLYQIDAFTDRRFSGNPAGVVPHAAGLSETDMQAIAREMNVSETAFVFPATASDHDMLVRFFTPTTEVPICGHATIAAHWVRALEGAPSGRVRQKTGAGILPVEIEREAGVTRIWMTQGAPGFGAAIEGPLKHRIGAALGGPALRADMPVQIVSTGHGKVMVPLRSATQLHGLAPDLQALSRLSEEIGCNGFFAFVLAAPEAPVLAHGRMFAPAIGIPEDPVTGNACGPLGAYLARHRHLPVDQGGQVRFEVQQGEAMGRPGRVTVEVTRLDPSFRIRVAGEAVMAFRTRLRLS